MNPGPESDGVLLDHVLECIGRVENYTLNGKAEFMGSRLIQDASIRNLQIMAESTQRLSQSIKISEPDIPWDKISGFRNMLTHAYFSVDVHLVWVVVEKDLQPLKAAVLRMIQRLPRGGCD